MQTQTIKLKEFNLTDELHKTLVNTLATSFGLDFLLAEDKVGGDVDTIHNVRKGIWATETEKTKYKEQQPYSKEISKEYHSDERYIAKNRQTSELLEKGKLIDQYRGTLMQSTEKKDLDHVISAKEIHNDAGRVLAEMSGVDLANQDYNFVATSRSINRSKGADSVEEFLAKTPQRIKQKDQKLEKLADESWAIAREEERKFDEIMEDHSLTSDEFSEKLAELENSPNQVRMDELAKQLENGYDYLDALEDINAKKMRKLDKKARQAYERQIQLKYYKSSKFFKSTAVAAGKEGLRMGTRQVLGLLFAEIWFELREQVPEIYQRCRQNFDLSVFLDDIKNVLANIWERVKLRFKDMISAFKDGMIGGILSSVNKTVLNIFSTTQKIISKLLREVWNALVRAVKLVFFNPNKLPIGDLAKEVTRLLSTAVAVALGAIVSSHLETMFGAYPVINQFASEIANFIGALTTGVLTIGISYFLDHSTLMQKVWDFLNSIKSKYELELEYYQKVNAELDRYLTELSKIEFNMNADELSAFATELCSINDEYHLTQVIGAEIKRRNIELPFEFGNNDSVRDFLKSKCRKN